MPTQLNIADCRAAPWRTASAWTHFMAARTLPAAPGIATAPTSRANTPTRWRRD
jgi:hypothetical protein